MSRRPTVRPFTCASICLALPLLAVLAARPARAQLASATYATSCATDPMGGGLISISGSLDAANPDAMSSWSGVGGGGLGFGCATDAGIGDPMSVPQVGPYFMQTTTSAGIATFFNGSLTYRYVATPSLNLPVDPATLLVPLQLIGVTRGRLIGNPLVGGTAGAVIFGSDFGGAGNAIRAAMDFSGNCTSGQLGTVGGLPTCFDLNLLTAQVVPGSSGSVTLTGQAAYSFSAAGSAASFTLADPLIRIDPQAEFAPGMRYADFFTVELSPGVVNAIPEPATGWLLSSGLVALAALRGFRTREGVSTSTRRALQ